MPKTKTVKLLIAGDLAVKNQVSLDPRLLTLMAQHDLVCCNLEGPIISEGYQPITKKGPAMRQEQDMLEPLVDLFDVFSLANNHIMDYGMKGLISTLDYLPNQSTVGVGTAFNKTYRPLIKNIKGIKIGFVSLSQWGFGAFDHEADHGFAWINHDCVADLIQDARKKVDFLIVQAHAGLGQTELPLPEWRRKYKQLVELGADCVIGHHPHHARGWEEFKGKMIFYSLGYFYLNFKNRGDEFVNNIIISLSVKSEKLLDYQVIPIHGVGTEVKLLQDSQYQSHLFDLCQLLQSDQYMQKINQMCNEQWEETYRGYYLTAASSLSFNQGLAKNIRSIWRKILNKNIDYKLLLHNLKIESHRYVVERYLQNNFNSQA